MRCEAVLRDLPLTDDGFASVVSPAFAATSPACFCCGTAWRH